VGAEFKFYKKDNGSVKGPLKVSPGAEFTGKTGFLGVPNKVTFHNLTGNDLTFSDDDGALKTGQKLEVPRGKTEGFEIDGAVAVGGVYGFTVTAQPLAGQESGPELLRAANPEIIITG
jgi:hypothetical protein